MRGRPRLSRRRSAVSGAHWVDEHEISEVEPGVGVVHELDWLQRSGAVSGELYCARSHSSQLQERRSCTWTTIEDEGDRSVGGVFPASIGGVEDIGRHLGLCPKQRQCPCHRRIGQLIGASLD